MPESTIVIEMPIFVLMLAVGAIFLGRYVGKYFSPPRPLFEEGIKLLGYGAGLTFLGYGCHLGPAFADWSLAGWVILILTFLILSVAFGMKITKAKMAKA